MPEIRHEVHYKSRLLPSFAERPPNVDAMLHEAVRSGRSDLAIVDRDRRVSYGELDDTVNRIAGNLARHGVGRGDRVAIVLGNKSAFIEVSFACARLGAIQVPINIRQRRPENEYVLDHSGAVAIVYEAELHDQIPDPAQVPNLRLRFSVDGASPGATPYETLLQAGAPPPQVTVHEDDPYCILYTSGTTGRPKGAVLTHYGVIHSCLNYSYAMGLQAGDRA